MNTNVNNPVIRIILNIIQKYNHEKYWGRRNSIVNSNKKNNF